jgi:hypothetical protein
VFQFSSGQGDHFSSFAREIPYALFKSVPKNAVKTEPMSVWLTAALLFLSENLT